VVAQVEEILALRDCLVVAVVAAQDFLAQVVQEHLDKVLLAELDGLAEAQQAVEVVLPLSVVMQLVHQMAETVVLVHQTLFLVLR
jgi:hypothetical protein